MSERPVEVMPDGSLRDLSKKEVRDWRKRTKTKAPEARLPWGHKTRYCVFCGKKGPRVLVGGTFKRGYRYAHRRCIPKPPTGSRP